MHSTTSLSSLFPQQPSSTVPATALALLSHERILSVNGVDATRFLQGQLTCDVAALAVGASTLGARCNPKGRMQSSFRLLKLNDEHYLLAMAAELLEAQLTDLSKYAVFFKVKLSDASDQWCRLGLWGEQTQQALQAASLSTQPNDSGVALNLPGAPMELWLPASTAAASIAALSQHAQPVPVCSWLLQQIRAGIGQVQLATRERFIPQMLNLDVLGAVSFSKGCYTGQEIVARMHYLGTLKRRMYRLLWSGIGVPEPGTDIIDTATDKVVGEVVIGVSAGEHIELLAVLQTDAAQLPTLSVSNSIEPSLELTSLPYEQQLATDAATN